MGTIAQMSPATKDRRRSNDRDDYSLVAVYKLAGSGPMLYRPPVRIWEFIPNVARAPLPFPQMRPHIHFREAQVKLDFPTARFIIPWVVMETMRGIG